MSDPAKRPLLTKGRVLLAVIGAAAFKLACAQPYPPGNLMAPPCPGGEPFPCKVPDAGTGDAGTMGGDQ